MHRRLPPASSSAATLVKHSFASSSETTLVPSSTVAATGLERKPSTASSGSDSEGQPSDSESSTFPPVAVHGAFKRPDNVARALLPFQVVANLVTSRPKKSTRMRKKNQARLSQSLALQSTHAEDIPPNDLELLRRRQIELERAVQALDIERNVVEARLGWYDRQCANFTTRQAEVNVYKRTKLHHHRTRWASESAMAANVDRKIAFNESCLKKGKDKSALNLSRKMPDTDHHAS